MHKKGQITIEFLLGLIGILSLFVISVQVYSVKNLQLQDIQEFYDSKHASLDLARNLNEIYLAGNGAAGEFYLQKVKDANVSISAGKVQVITRSQTAETAIIARTITVNSTLTTGVRIRIQNINNGLVIGFA